MAGEQIITYIGNLTADPEMRTTQQGVPVVNFTIASTPRTFDRTTNDWKDGEASFLRCNAWREIAEHINMSLKKGTRVIAQGVLAMKNYQDAQGNPRTSWELEVQAIGPDLKYATAQVTRAGNNAGGGQQQGQQQAAYGAPQGAYGPPQGQQQMAPQQQAYQPPQGQQQGYQQPPQQQPQQQAPQQQQQQPQQGYQQPQQGQQPQQQQVQQQQQQQPQPGSAQAAQQGQWQQPGAFGDDTPF